MAEQLKTNPYRAWIAIDIAKDYNAVLIEVEGINKRQHFRMANSAVDHDRFIKLLQRLPEPCVVGFEATGNYHRTLGHRLVIEGFDVCFVS